MATRSYDRIFIDGGWVPSTGTETIPVVDSTTEEVMATIPAGTAEDVDRAVAAARAAFEGWSTMAVEDRAKLLEAVADGLTERADEIADVITREAGMSLRLSQRIQVALPITSFR